MNESTGGCIVGALPAGSGVYFPEPDADIDCVGEWTDCDASAFLYCSICFFVLLCTVLQRCFRAQNDEFDRLRVGLPRDGHAVWNWRGVWNCNRGGSAVLAW